MSKLSTMLRETVPTYESRDPALSPDALAIREAVTKVFIFPSESASLASPQLDMRRRLMEIAREACTDNWDGESSAAVREAALADACAVIALLPGTIPLPEITVDRDGGISFDWHRSRSHMYTISVPGDGMIYYAGLFGTSRDHGQAVFGQSLPLSVRDHIRRLFADEYVWANAG